jgi:hypothetical protein
MYTVRDIRDRVDSVNIFWGLFASHSPSWSPLADLSPFPGNKRSFMLTLKGLMQWKNDEWTVNASERNNEA